MILKSTVVLSAQWAWSSLLLWPSISTQPSCVWLCCLLSLTVTSDCVSCHPRRSVLLHACAGERGRGGQIWGGQSFFHTLHYLLWPSNQLSLPTLSIQSAIKILSIHQLYSLRWQVIKQDETNKCPRPKSEGLCTVDDPTRGTFTPSVWGYECVRVCAWVCALLFTVGLLVAVFFL